MVINEVPVLGQICCTLPRLALALAVRRSSMTLTTAVGLDEEPLAHRRAAWDRDSPRGAVDPFGKRVEVSDQVSDLLVADLLFCISRHNAVGLTKLLAELFERQLPPGPKPPSLLAPWQLPQ
jgi:hypothetical protein